VGAVVAAAVTVIGCGAGLGVAAEVLADEPGWVGPFDAQGLTRVGGRA
jgi:hypothetical protein